MGAWVEGSYSLVEFEDEEIRPDIITEENGDWILKPMNRSAVIITIGALLSTLYSFLCIH